MAMWQPPPTVRTESVLSSNMDPRDAAGLYRALGKRVGAPVGEFWNMWDFCDSCDHVVLAGKMKEHQCVQAFWELCEGCNKIVIAGEMGDHTCDLTRD